MYNMMELTSKETLEIYGGRPDLETSPFYDIGWYVGAAIRHIENWLK